MTKLYLDSIIKGEGPEYILLAKHNGEYRVHTTTNNLITLIVKLSEIWEKVSGTKILK